MLKDVPRYLRERWRTEIEALFSESEREDVLDWLIANHDRRRVVLVGAGFSRNARRAPSVHVPLWQDISKALATDLRISVHSFDALSLVDFHQRNLGPSAFQARLLSLLDDDALDPGEAHAALWSSKPEAIITTNFLDTLLERDDHARPVIEDPDLALPVAADDTQVIYLHGHRSNFGSWVAGRSDYDDLEQKRPMLFARTRQLFAQFPLLVVGYSLTDPDFHLVYRQMVRAMQRRHPMGLAVVLPGREDGAAEAERAAKKYWEDLGLRIVRFRTDASPEEAFVRFFGLTRRIDNRQELERSYQTCETASDVAATFRANAEIMTSAFEDGSLDLWLRPETLAPFWRSALTKALPEPLRKAAADKAQKYNQARSRGPRASDGTKQTVPLGDVDSRDRDVVPELDKAFWLGSHAGATDGLVGDAWARLEQQRGSPLVWELQELRDAGRSNVAEWLRRAVTPEILDDYVDVVVVACGLLLLGDLRADDVHLVNDVAVPRDPRVAEMLQRAGIVARDDEPVVALLKRAREAIEAGQLALAQERYAEALALLPSSAHRDTPLLTYFALRGSVDALDHNDFSSDALRRLTQANDRAVRQREDRRVRRWWDRVDRFAAATRRATLKRLEDEAPRAGYERTSVSWANSGWRLYVLLQDAVRLGAPLSVQSELTEPLLGGFTSDEAELGARLALNLGDPGKWLSHRLQNGDALRKRTTGFMPDYMQANAEDRSSGASRIGEVLFPKPAGEPPGVAATAESATTVSKLRPRVVALLGVLNNAAEVLLQEHVVDAVDAIAKARQVKEAGYIVEALAGVSRVCKWSTVRAQVLEVSRSDELHHLRRKAGSFPWEHWTICDDFLSDGGIELVRNLVTDISGFDRMSAGWALVDLLTAAPANDLLVSICVEFAERAVAGEAGDRHSRDSDVEQVAALAAASGRFLARAPGVMAWLRELLQRGDSHARGILLQAPGDCPLLADAKASLEKTSAPSGETGALDTVDDHVLLVVLSEVHQGVEWQRVRAALEKTWRELPSLARALRHHLWTTEGWRGLQDVLRTGGHRGKARSWLVARMRLIVDGLRHPHATQAIFDDSPDGLGFLRFALVDAIGSGDGILANHAVYGLPALAQHVTRDADARAIAGALCAAADDVRIGVAHGAAFTASYLDRFAAVQHVHPEILEVAREVKGRLSEDPLAVVRRQATLGSKQGERAAQDPRGRK